MDYHSKPRIWFIIQSGARWQKDSLEIAKVVDVVVVAVVVVVVDDDDIIVDVVISSYLFLS